MHAVKKIVCVLTLLATVQFAAARTVDLMSFGFTDLNGSFTSGSSLFTAVDDGNSEGDVSRLISPTGDAFFVSGGPGGFPGLAAFDLTMTVSAISPTLATVLPGAGSITMTDVNGDTFTGGVQGTWINVIGSGNFVGVLTNVAANNNSGDGMFNGNTGSFSLAFPPPPFVGNILTLAFQDWFTDGSGALHDFRGSNTLAEGAVIPEPASFALLLVGGLAAAVRRRRTG